MRKIAVLMPLVLLGAAPPTDSEGLDRPLTGSPLAPLPDCRRLLGAGSEPAKFRRLRDLPPANAYHAMRRLSANGCHDPIVISYGHGSPTGPKPARRR